MKKTTKPIDFDALVSGLLKVDPKQLPPKPGKKNVIKKTVTNKKPSKKA